MNKNYVIGVLVIIAIVGGGAFWGGMTYAASKSPARGGQFFAQGGPNGARGARTGNGGAFGSIIAKDATSITVQLGGPNATSTNGSNTGTKIVLYDTNTQIGKFTTGSLGDLSVGENVAVTGTANSDGSITAQMIQIRPTGTPRPGGQ